MPATESVSTVEIRDHLGSGHFGSVHRGSQVPHGDVAVKVIDCDRMSLELGITDWSLLRAHLQAEAENLRKAEHPHVVRVHGVGNTPDQKSLHIVTELCEGSILGMSKGGPLEARFATRSIEDALQGLLALHNRRMIHRDLKPGNLLFKDGRTKLADFGLVTDRLLHGYANRAGYTEHLAPEVHKDRVTSTKTDVWAMGLTVYRMVNGEPWYLSEKERLKLKSLKNIVDMVCGGGFASKLRWMPHVPSALRRFVRKAMHDDSARRFVDGGQMLTAFQSLVRPLSQPAWSCEVQPLAVRWSAPSDSERRWFVEWQWKAARQHRVVARTEPIAGGKGRPRTFLEHDGIAESRALHYLDAFFDSRVSK